MCSRYAMWLLLVWLLSEAAYVVAGEPSIRSIDVQGNRTFAARTILSWIDSRPGQQFDSDRLSRDVNAILDHYRNAGYWLTSIQLVKADGEEDIAIQFRIVEGPLCRVERVEITGNTALDRDQLLSLMEMRSGQPLAQRTFEADIDQVLQWYENHGYAIFARDLFT